MTNTTNTNEVAKFAYELWERAGRPDGRSEEFWLTAEHHFTSVEMLRLAERRIQIELGIQTIEAANRAQAQRELQESMNRQQRENGLQEVTYYAATG